MEKLVRPAPDQAKVQAKPKQSNMRSTDFLGCAKPHRMHCSQKHWHVGHSLAMLDEVLSLSHSHVCKGQGSKSQMAMKAHRELTTEATTRTVQSHAATLASVATDL
jgi:hypothetical protein